MGTVQGRGTNPALETSQPESLFRDHVNEVHKRACAGFVDLMDAMLKPLLPPTPKAVRLLLSELPQIDPAPCRQ